MATKIFSVQLRDEDKEKNVRKNEEKLSQFEEKINKFLEGNKDFKESNWLQSSGASQWGEFTTITAVYKSL